VGPEEQLAREKKHKGKHSWKFNRVWEENEEEGDDTFIVAWDFQGAIENTIPRTFYYHLRRLHAMGGFEWVQKSVALCRSVKGMRTLRAILDEYGANVRVWRIAEEIV